MNLRSSASCVALAAAFMTLVVAAPSQAAVPPTDPGDFYSSKQPYIEPSAADIAEYSTAPAGYAPLATESVARHGSRGLSGYKYDLLLRRLAETALDQGGFLTPEIGDEFIANIDAITAANVENGYGMLTGQGETQHQGIGERVVARNAALFADADNRIVAETSGEARATESGENFLFGLGDAELALEPRPDLLYFHKVENPDGSEKAPGTPERARADAYEAYIEAQTDDGGTIAAATEFIEERPESVRVSEELLSGIFTPAFIAAMGADAAHTWYATVDGTKGGAPACAPGADPAADPDACSDPKKSITSAVDAAMTLYNLYIIAADMEQENVSPHEFDFAQYFEGREADAEWFAYLLDAEDFYEKGPSLAGHDETYAVAQPLLDDFFRVIDDRAAGGDVAATFRFAHAETIVPFAALLKLPGSTVPAPDVAAPASVSDVFDYASNPWRGSQVTPMAANVQWDVVSRAGVDPATGATYTPLVRMLYNEREIAFADGCRPVAEGSHWVKVTELKRCLTGAAMAESPLIGDVAPVDDTIPGPELAATGGGADAVVWGLGILLLLVGTAAASRRRAFRD